MRVCSAALILIAFMTSNAGSQVYDSAMVFDRGYAASSPGWWVCCPPGGSPLLIVGTVKSFNAPLTSLLPVNGTYEATYIFEGMTHVGSYDYGDGCGSTFEGGGFKIYIDQTPDASPADVSTYRDGELVLEASLQGDFYLETNVGDFTCPFLCPPTQFGSFVFCGGSWFSHVSDGNGQGYWAHNVGCFYEEVREPLRQMGYMGLSDSWVNIQAPISANASTWGAIKALYR